MALRIPSLPSLIRPRWQRVPITALLIFGLSTLVVMAIGGVLLVTLGAATRNTIGLLEDKSRLILMTVVDRTRQFLDPAEAQADFLARLIETGQLDPDDPEELFGALRVALAANPQGAAAVYLDADGWMIAVERGAEEPQLEITDWRISESGVAAMSEASLQERRGAFWGPPLFAEGPGTTVLNLRRPVWRGERFMGLIASSITIQELSRFLISLESEIGQNAFILYGRDRVLAHQSLEDHVPEIDDEHPLPTLEEVGDPVLAQIWREGYQDRALVAGSGHADEIGGQDYIFLYRELGAFGEPPWIVGSYFAEEDIGSQFIRLVRAAAVGVAGLVMALLFAILLGRKVGRPIGELAEAAAAVRALDLDHLPVLRRSRLREIDQANMAFNAMAGALRVFQLYVPKKLVQTLIRRRTAGVRSESREVTILFTDIWGFTGRVENLSAEDTAAFLNHHFGLVTRCIEAEDGMVDKYIGDAVMALWNAVEDQPDHALRALRAAAAIAEALHADNRGSEVPVRIRIGLHTGQVVVGNIGAPARMNFTVVGDAVNIAERLQALGRTLCSHDEVAILVSADTATQLPRTEGLQPLGAHVLRGREEAVEIFRLAV